MLPPPSQFRAWRSLRVLVAAVGACFGCNAIFGIEEPVRKPTDSALTCTLNSDCPAGGGQVCIFSRCSPACVTDRDCPATGERCLHTDLGAACVSEAQAACDSATTPCPSGTTCVDGACYGTCSATLACTDGHTCVDGACKGPPPSGGEGGGGAIGGSATGGGTTGGSTPGGSGEGGAAGGPVVPEAACGDGTIDDGETCDDQDAESGDGCSATCRLEEGWDCGQSEPSVCAPICGDGRLVGDEAQAGGCDDQDVEPGDGCDASCKVESTFVCSSEPSTCAKTCGNSKLDVGEVCDDGNPAAGDGCFACAQEKGFTCSSATLPSTCSDVNECTTDTDNCHALATCTNSTGSFSCACKAGYVGNGVSCTDENECTAGTDNCHASATCTNSTGSFSCACMPGFTGTGVACADINECTSGTHNCHAKATCTNTPGSFSCACKGGLTGNGVTSCAFAQLVGKLDGRLITIPCGDTPAADDCTNGGAISEGVTKACSQGQLDAIYDHPIAGPAGVQYTATLRFYGIVEPKNYGPNITRESLTVRPGMGNPSSPAPFAVSTTPGAAYQASGYDTYEVRVFDHTSTEVGSYFLNSDTTEGHYTFAIDFERPIRIIGGGFVRVRRFDSNCRIMKNCGSGGAPCGGKARSIGISAASPQPVGLTQPGLGLAADHAGQWLLIDVTDVDPL